MSSDGNHELGDGFAWNDLKPTEVHVRVKSRRRILLYVQERVSCSKTKARVTVVQILKLLYFR